MLRKSVHLPVALGMWLLVLGSGAPLVQADGLEAAVLTDIRATARPLARVPNLIGMTQPQAQIVLLSRGLKGHYHLQSGGIGQYRVYRQSIAAGTAVLKGRLVRAYMKRRPSIVPRRPAVRGARPKAGPAKSGNLTSLYRKVPNLIGKTKAQAQATLEARQLRAAFFGSGQIVKMQSPNPGKRVTRGTTVTAKLK